MHHLDPDDFPDGSMIRVSGGKFVVIPPILAVPTIVLEHGQTITQWEAANGVTLPTDFDVTILELDS